MCKSKQFDKRYIAAKYINRYIYLKSSAEMQEMQLFPNVKEIQESFAILNIIETRVLQADPEISIKGDNVVFYVIGDGATPRTGGLLAFMTKWKGYSIDPFMRKTDYPINNLTIIKDKGENVIKNIVEDKEFVFLIFPHSHIANTNEIYKHFKDKKVWLINMPCCVPQQDDHLPIKNWFCFKDDAVNSPKNVIKLYCNYLDKYNF